MAGFNVRVKLNIDQETAETCLRLVEIYLNDHDGTYINSVKQDDGTLRLRFAEWAPDGFAIPCERLVGDAAKPV